MTTISAHGSIAGLSHRTIIDCDIKNVWPEERRHLLDEGIEFKVAGIVANDFHANTEREALSFYPALFADPLILVCDCGDYLVVYQGQKQPS